MCGEVLIAMAISAVVSSIMLNSWFVASSSRSVVLMGSVNVSFVSPVIFPCISPSPLFCVCIWCYPCLVYMSGQWLRQSVGGSVLVGWIEGSMSQVMNGEGELVQCHTLSGHVQLPEFLASRVGMLCGRAISRRMLTTRSRREFSSQSGLLRWSLVLASQVL